MLSAWGLTRGKRGEGRSDEEKEGVVGVCVQQYIPVAEVVGKRCESVRQLCVCVCGLGMVQ